MADEAKPKKEGGILGVFRDVVYGMSSHEMTRHAVRTRASMEHLFILITMGDLLSADPAALLLAPAPAVRDAADRRVETEDAAGTRRDGRPRLARVAAARVRDPTGPPVHHGRGQGRGGLGYACGHWRRLAGAVGRAR